MVVTLAVNLLGPGQQRFDPAANAELDQRVTRIGLLDDAVDELADAILILVEHHVALGFTDALEDYLLCRLRSNPAEVVWGHVGLFDLITVDRELLRIDHRLCWLDVLARLRVKVGLLVDRFDDQLRFKPFRDLQLNHAVIAGLSVKLDARVLNRR